MGKYRRENQKIKRYFASLNLPHYESLYCETLKDGTKNCIISFHYDLDEGTKFGFSNDVNDHPDTDIAARRNGKLIWFGSKEVNEWVKKQVAEIKDLLKKKLGLPVNAKLEYATFTYPLPPMLLGIPEIWDHVPIEEAKKLQVLRPHEKERNPNAPKAIEVISLGFNPYEAPYEARINHEAGTVFMPVKAARELTQEEIDKIMRDGDEISQRWLKRDLEVRKFFKFVGGSPFSDEIWELVKYAGIRLQLFFRLPKTYVNKVKEERVLAG